QIVDGGELAGAQVEGALAAMIEGEKARGGDVGEVKKVASLLTVYKDGGLAAFQHQAGKERHDLALLRIRMLAGPVNVGIAQDRVIEAVHTAEGLQIHLAGGLGGGVGADGVDRVV